MYGLLIPKTIGNHSTYYQVINEFGKTRKQYSTNLHARFLLLLAIPTIGKLPEDIKDFAITRDYCSFPKDSLLMQRHHLQFDV